MNPNVNYLRRASGTLRATADVVRAGGTIGVSTVTVAGRIPDEAEGDVAEGTSAGRRTGSDDAADRWEGTEESEAVAAGQAAYRLFRD